MTPHEIKKITLSDRTPIMYREWYCPQSKDIIIYLHGLESHSAWFIDAADVLYTKGYSVIGLERRGSGLSREDTTYIKNYSVLIDDIREMILHVRKQQGDVRVYLMGICWGGKIAALFGAEFPQLIDGLIFVSPGIITKVDLSFKEKMDVVLSNLFKPKKLFDVPLDDCLFTKSEHYRTFMKKDSLKLKKVSARFFFETGKINIRLKKLPSQITVPVLMLLADEDEIVDTSGVKKWYSLLQSQDKSIKIYQGFWHCLFFEDGCQEVIDDIARWIEKRKEGQDV